MSIFEKMPEDYDPAILVPNRYHENLKMWFLRCPCGVSAGLRDGGELSTHFPPMGPGTKMMTDPFYSGTSACRYSGRTVTLEAALERDERLTLWEGAAKRSVVTPEEVS